jgi:hypothetical protein
MSKVIGCMFKIGAMIGLADCSWYARESQWNLFVWDLSWVGVMIVGAWLCDSLYEPKDKSC